MKNFLSKLILAGVAMGLAGAALAAGGLARTITLNIEPQAIRTALEAFASQTGLQVVMREEDVGAEGLNAPGVRGTLPVEEALERLLANSGLKYEFVNERTVRIATTAAAPKMSMTGGIRDGMRLAQADTPAASSGSASSGQDSPANRESLPSEALEEIVVTAQKRKERLSDVPISITVLNGEQLDRSTDRGIAEALSRVPGVIGAVNNAGARSNAVSAVVVRGVAPIPGAGGGGGATGYYLDSIPFGFIRRSDAPDSSAYDLERVEVLRGPQGTLYGVSALNGVVRILTHDADLDAFDFKARSSVSSTQDGDESYRGDLAVNAPLIAGKLAARAVVGYQNVGGWIDKPIGKDVNDAEIGNYRLKVNAQPTERLSVGLSTWFSRGKFDAPPVSPDNKTSLSLFEEPSRVDFDAYGLKVGYDFAGLSVTSMTSYLDFTSKSAVDFFPVATALTPNILFNQTNASEVFSQEIVLNSRSGGRWRWSLGGIYRDASEQLFQTRSDPLTGALCCTYLAPTDQRTYSESFAVFGELTRAFLDGRFELTGGLRYFEDDVTDREKSFFQAAGGIPVGGLATSDSKFDNVSPRAVLTWHPGERLAVYASYAEGFRSGLNQLPAVRRIAPAFGPVEPDELKSYELGAKGSLWSGRISFDTAAFYIDWQDVQQSLIVLVAPPSVRNNALINAGSASGPGFELSVGAEPVTGLTLGATFSWNDLTIDSDIFSGTTLVFEKGSRLTISPERSVGFSADYGFALGGGGLKGRISAATNYLPRMITFRSNATTFFSSDPIWNSRASVGIESSGRWLASLFADNLGNEDDVTSRDTFPAWQTALRPRTIGLQLEYRFR